MPTECALMLASLLIITSFAGSSSESDEDGYTKVNTTDLSEMIKLLRNLEVEARRCRELGNSTKSADE